MMTEVGEDLADDVKSPVDVSVNAGETLFSHDIVSNEPVSVLGAALPREMMLRNGDIRLKTALPLRFISTLFLIPLTTLVRHCQRLALLLAALHEWDTHEADHLIVDMTSTRVRSTNG